MHRRCEDDLSSDTKAAGLGQFLLKFDNIRKFVTKGASLKSLRKHVYRSVSEFLPVSKINNPKAIF